MEEITLRAATAADVETLGSIYIDAVQTIGPQCYSTAGIAAWQRWPTDSPDEFRQRVLAGHTLIAEVEGEPAAFAEFTPPDHLDFLYTCGRFARRGLAERLHRRLESIARESGASLLRTEASLLSRPAFAKFGYEVLEIEDVERFGETFRRYRMRKLLRAAPPATAPLAACRAGYDAAFANPPKVAAGEVVQLIEKDPNHPGWFKGRTATGESGYFPVAWFAIAGSDATAMRDYDARELTVRVGDLVGIVEIESSWARVMKPSGEVGWVPAEVAPAQG